jgi:hypothetical protein
MHDLFNSVVTQSDKNQSGPMPIRSENRVVSKPLSRPAVLDWLYFKILNLLIYIFAVSIIYIIQMSTRRTG